MSTLENDAEIVQSKPRKNILRDDPSTELQVTASLRDQQLSKLAKKLEEMNVSMKVVEMWNSANADRAEQLKRQDAYLEELEEFIEPIYTPALDWSSTIHLPTILTVCKTYHARFFAALWGVDPPFVCRSRTAANVDRAMLVEELMRYTLRDWCNEYDGVEPELDRWLWYWITKGDGYLKARWWKKFTRFMDVESEQVPEPTLILDEQTGNSVEGTKLKEIEREVVRTEEVYNGPMLEVVDNEDLVVIGGNGDCEKADAVIEQGWYTASEMWSLADQKLFRLEAVEAALKGGKDYKSSEANSNIKDTKARQSGKAQLDNEYETDRYRVLEAYLRLDVDDSGIASDVVVWIHARSRKILRATYLRRVMASGRRPYFGISFHKRYGTEYSVGLPEMLYSLGKEIDAMHNINVDIGILSSLPFGFYKPTTASLKSESMPIEPGALIPVDNPRTDIMFPNLGMRTSFGFQEEAALMNQIERLTSISELNLGIIGAQGATRTATGTRAILGESSNNLNIYIQRMNRGWKRALRYIFEMLQHRLPPGFQFRVVGDDGSAYWREVQTKQEICGMYDFELDPNSANSNKQIQLESANLIMQATQNPIDLQLGIVTPANRYEALLHWYKVNGIKQVSKFISKPADHMINFSPIEMADRLLRGIDIPLNPMMDLEGFVTWVESAMNDDEIMGQFSPIEAAILQAKAREAVAMLEAVQAAQANVAVQQQQLQNTQASQMPGNVVPMAVQQRPAAGEGG